MRRVRAVWAGFTTLWRKSRSEQELDRELQQFLEASIDAKLAVGMNREAAERAARLELGSPAAVKDWVRDVGWESRLESVWQDVRYALRLMIRAPAFSLGTLVTIGLGTGAAIAVYSVAYGVLLRPLPVTDEASIAILYRVDEIRADAPISYPRFEAWRNSGVFTDLAAVGLSSFDVVSGGVAERVPAEAVTENFFRLVGVTSSLGRLLDDRDTVPASDSVPAVISHSLWTRRFAADPTILGRRVPAGTNTLVIVGVAAEGFDRWRRDAQVWVPIEAVNAPRILASEGYSIATPVARLRPDVSLALAHERLLAVNRIFDNELGSDRNRVPGDVRLVKLRDDVVPDTLKLGIVVLMLAVGLTWFVVCANVSNLLLGRGTQRASEFAVRLALGAHRHRIGRQLLIESMVLALPGGIVGILLAYWGVRSLVAFGPPGVIGNEAVRVDLPVVFAAGVLVLTTAIACGTGPAVRLSRATLREVLSARTAPMRFSPLLLGGQFAIAAFVLIAAALLVKSVWRMQRVDLGFQSANVLTVRFTFPQRALTEGASGTNLAWRAAAQDAIVARLAALPGVQAATVTDVAFRPIRDHRWSISLDDGRRFLNGMPKDRPFAPRSHTIGPSYFRIHVTPLLEGREFTVRDAADAQAVVVINRTMAEMLWPGDTAIGRRINFGRWNPRTGFDEPWHEIVGVAEDMRYGSVEEPFGPEVYRPAAQAPLSGGVAMLKTQVEPMALARSARIALQSVDPALHVYAARTLDEIVAESTALTRYTTALMTICALIASVLCAGGVYSLLAFRLASMRRELAIRLALGAEPGVLVAEVLGQGLRPLVPGIAAGVILAAAASPAAANVLFEVSPRDPFVFAGGALTVVSVGLAAAWLSARRAARLDPLVALRAE